MDDVHGAEKDGAYGACGDDPSARRPCCHPPDRHRHPGPCRGGPPASRGPTVLSTIIHFYLSPTLFSVSQRRGRKGSSRHKNYKSWQN